MTRFLIETRNRHIIISILLSCALCVGLAQNHVPGPIEDTNLVVDNTLDSLNKVRTMRPEPGSSRKGDNPVLFLVGNSTMRTGTAGNGDNGQWGWGYFMPEYFDEEKITVENHALGGTSSRTFYNRLWPGVLKGVRKGDWVIIELGHNDNGPYDSGRARASIPGIGKDSLTVTIKETGAKETVYTYGEYMRRFIHDVKRKGAHPIIMSLTPRNAWDDADSTIITRCDKTFGLWAKQVAKKEKVPFIDLNDITATKFERFGKEKVKYMFYLDRIHTSAFGARVNAESAVEGIRGCKNLPLAAMLKPEVVDTITGASRVDGRPVLFTIGDSTVKNADSDDDGMWGWGSVINELFDSSKISVENHAMAGRSARTFLDEGRWDKVYNALQPGDFVLIQFGHNDAGDINVGKARAELPGSGSKSKVFRMESTGQNKVIYTYGWYLRKFILDCHEKGAIPIVLSHTPRNKFDNGAIESNRNGFGKWAKEAARSAGAWYIDLNEISGKFLQDIADTRGLKEVNRYFCNDHTHTSKMGARMNARSIAAGLKSIGCPLSAYLLADLSLPTEYVKQTASITVTNPGNSPREELAETDAMPLKERFPDGFVLKNKDGREVPYQITYDGKMIFPVSLAAKCSEEFIIESGSPSDVASKVYGRHFPEHKDNFSWENDKGAYTAYGPALQAAGERGYGYDIWTKSVDSLVLESRYKLDAEGLSMHKDNGNGMDAYIVASSLGGGATALLDDNGDIIFPWAWQKHEVLDNGPLRMTVRLTYGPATIGNDSNVIETRLISLDAGSWLNRTVVNYDGLTTRRKIASGPVVHQQNPDGYTLGDGYVAYADLTEDAHADNGVIYLGAVTDSRPTRSSFLPIKDATRDATGHALLTSDYAPGDKYVYYWGSAWSKGSHPRDWNEYLQQFKTALDTPLEVKITMD